MPMENKLAVGQGVLNGDKAVIDLRLMFDHPSAVVALQCGPQTLASSGQLFVIRGELLQGWRFQSKALGHAVVFRDGLCVDPLLQPADCSADPLQRLRTGHGGRLRKGVLARGWRQVLPAVILFGLPDRRMCQSQKPCASAPDQLVITAQLIFSPVEVIAPAVKEVGGDLPKKSCVVEIEEGHGGWVVVSG